MRLRPQLYARDLSGEEVVTPNVMFEVERLSKRAIGGPAQATATAKGDPREIWRLFELLRCPVVIHTERGKPVWWGYVEQVWVQQQGVNVGVTLERMVNRVRVVYSAVNAAGTVGERQETGWEQDATSVAQYGIKERKFSLQQGTSEQAAAYAKTLLQRLKYPIPQRQIEVDQSEVTATLFFSGWWSTLGWKYYEDSSGKESYEEIGDGLQAFGDGAGVTWITQSFQAPIGGWSASTVQLRMRREGTPGDEVAILLQTDDGGLPGNLLASAYLPGVGISENLNWHTFTLNTRVPIAANTTYWISVTRNGALDAANYYKVDSNEELGYPRGVMRLYTGSVWVPRSPDADMLFQVGGVRETSTQLKTMLEAGQFITGVDLDIASGVYSSPYRDGDQTALMCVEELLQSGTSNDRRMLATVDENRRVRVYEEPVYGGEWRDTTLLHNNGKLYDYLDREIDASDYPVGVWSKLKEITSTDLPYIADPNWLFVEEVMYDAKRGINHIRERDAGELLEIA